MIDALRRPVISMLLDNHTVIKNIQTYYLRSKHTKNSGMTMV